MQEYWKFHDEQIKKLKNIYNKINNQTKTRLQEIFKGLEINSNNIYNIASKKTKNMINEKIEEWKNKKLLKGYFGFLANNIYNRTRVKNNEILELLIYSAYIEEQEKLNSYENKIIYDDLNYYYRLGQEEVNNTLSRNKKRQIIDLTDMLFLSLLSMPTSTGYEFEKYKQNIVKINSDNLYKQVVIDIQQNKGLDIDNIEIQNILKRQLNSKININGDKISGAIDLQLIELNNNSKLEGIKRIDEDAKVKFIAVEDESTTKMCESLNGQIFNVHDWNTFYRYSKTNDRITKYKCFGLVRGLNLPPIDDGFHWCRSTITYQVSVEKERKTEYNISNYLRMKIAKNYKSILNDLKVIQKEYDMLPQNVKDRLEKENVTIVLNDNSKNSGYNPKTKEIILIPDLEEGEFIHEIGHALYYNLKVSKYDSYKNIVDNIINGSIIKEYKERVKLYYGLETKYDVASDYQTFLGYDKLTAQLKLANKELIEVMSEAYREYYFGKNQSKELNDLVEEVEGNA